MKEESKSKQNKKYLQNKIEQKLRYPILHPIPWIDLTYRFCELR